jgi:hypothetical protein|tara:strand:+ start:796 stop:1047 length:252 start_codon:yes stop_codon:yes gene_type:complete
MRYKCNYCEKFVSNPITDFDGKGKQYFFCNKDCYNNYEDYLLELAEMGFHNPFILAFNIGKLYIKLILSKFRKEESKEEYLKE